MSTYMYSLAMSTHRAREQHSFKYWFHNTLPLKEPELLQKFMTPVLGHRQGKRSLDYLFIPKSREVLKE